MSEHERYSWYTIETDEAHAFLFFNNKKGVHRQENKRRLEDIAELEEIKAKREASKERINKIVGEAIKEAMRLAVEDPEEFKRRMNR